MSRPGPGAGAEGRYRSQSWLDERSASPATRAGRRLLKTPAGLARIHLTTHGDLVKSCHRGRGLQRAGARSRGRWRRACAGGASTTTAVAAVVARSGAARRPRRRQPSGSSPPCSRPGDRQADVLSAGPAPSRHRPAGPELDRTRHRWSLASSRLACRPASVTGTSPEYVRISMASAIALAAAFWPLQPRLRLRRHQPPAQLRRRLPVRLWLLRPGPH